jgi:hypothetical protein
MASPLENDAESTDKTKGKAIDAVKAGSDTGAGAQEAKPEVKAVQEMTTADWQSANKQGADKQGASNQVASSRGTDTAVADQPASLPKVSLEAPAPPSPKDILISPAASAEEKLKAVEALGRAGQTTVEVVDKDGTKRNLTIELEKAGARTLVHLYANDDQGKERVILRGVKNADGSWQQQQTEKGDAVGSYGTWWSKNMGDRSFFNDAVKPDTRVAEQKAAPEDLFSAKRNEIPPVIPGDQSKDVPQNNGATKLADASQLDLFPDKRNLLPDAPVPAFVAPEAKLDAALEPPKFDANAKVYAEPPMLEPYVKPYTAPPQLDAQAIPRAIEERRDVSIQDLPVPTREVVVPWNRPPQRVVSDEERLNELFDGVAKSAGYARRMTRVDGGSVYFRAGMAIDADGSPRARQIDPDGQSNTSLRHKGGAPVNAETTKYFVLPLEKYQQYGVRLGDIAAVRYDDQVRFAVFADVGPHQKLGEGSMALAASLGINSNPRRGGTQRPEVEYIVFPGSGNGRPLHSNAHEGLGRHYLGKAYRNTKSS